MEIPFAFTILVIVGYLSSIIAILAIIGGYKKDIDLLFAALSLSLMQALAAWIVAIVLVAG